MCTGMKQVIWRLLCMGVFVILAGCSASERQYATTQVTIDSSPEQGVTVFVDGIEHGVTPVAIEGLIPGFHDILLQKDGYQAAVDQVEVKGEDAQQFIIPMKALTAYLTLVSKPQGAEVYVDGRPVGFTPLTRYELRVGTRRYEIRREGFYPAIQELQVEKSNLYEFSHELKPQEADLVVLSQPTGADIWLNNQAVKEKTPAKFRLAPDLYMVSVYTNGHIQADETLELAANEKKQITLKMMPGNAPPGMVLVPKGEFLMGENGRAPDEAPRRSILLPAFYIDKYEVTNNQYQKVFPKHIYEKGQDHMPVAGVSWYQAKEYARKTGKRLPTEAEWEKAARGTDGREFPWGEIFESIRCNSKEAGREDMAFVGKLLGGVSPYGCMDMAGNAYEWVEDWYQAYPGNKAIGRDYGQVFRVLRGGSNAVSQFQVRCARRHFDKMDAARADYGFRCASDIEKAGP